MAKDRSRCTSCGMTLEQLKKNRRVGCSHDYEIFHDFFVREVKAFHGAAEHCGKFPAVLTQPSRSPEDIERLKKELENAVRTESYEEAARIRDLLKRAETEH